jgi:hypothetical protein
VQALAMLFLRLHGYSYIITMIFFGAYVFLLGWLIARSSFLPRILGWLLIIGGLADICCSMLILLTPDSVPDGVLSSLNAIGAIAEISICLWLTVFGLGAGKWHASAG